MQCCRACRQHVDSERKLGEYFPPTFQSGFSKSNRTISKESPKRFHILKGFKVPGIASNILRNKSALSWEFVQPASFAFKLFARENMAFYTKQDFLFHIDTTQFDGRSSSESKVQTFFTHISKYQKYRCKFCKNAKFNNVRARRLHPFGKNFHEFVTDPYL